VATTDASLRVGCAVRGAFSHTFISAAINAFFRSKRFFLGDWGGYGSFLTSGNRAVQTTESFKADAQAICAQPVVRALVWAQLDFARRTSETMAALALASSLVADTVLVAVVGACTHITCNTTPGLRARLARLAVACASHSVTRAVAGAILRAFLVAAVSSEEHVVARAGTVDAQTIARAHLG